MREFKHINGAILLCTHLSLVKSFNRIFANSCAKLSLKVHWTMIATLQGADIEEERRCLMNHSSLDFKTSGVGILMLRRLWHIHAVVVLHYFVGQHHASCPDMDHTLIHRAVLRRVALASWTTLLGDTVEVWWILQLGRFSMMH